VLGDYGTLPPSANTVPRGADTRVPYSSRNRPLLYGVQTAPADNGFRRTRNVVRFKLRNGFRDTLTFLSCVKVLGRQDEAVSLGGPTRYEFSDIGRDICRRRGGPRGLLEILHNGEAASGWRPRPDLPQGFRTRQYVRDWLPIRREQCAKRGSRKSRWSRSSARRIARSSLHLEGRNATPEYWIDGRQHRPLRRRHSGKGRAVPVRCP
jgi:hypothetical protein